MTADQATKELFAQNGFLHLPHFIDPTECQNLTLRMRELVFKREKELKNHIFEAGENRQSIDDYFLASAQKISFFFDKSADGVTNTNSFAKLNKVGHALHNLCPVYKKFSHQEKFYQLMRLLGHRKPLPIQSMFIFKQSHFGDAVPAHQDATFLFTEPDSVIGLWFALEDADENNGCLWVMPGGHKGHLKHRFIRTKNGLSFTDHQKTDWPRDYFKPIPVKAGDAIVLHGLLPHLSEQNRSSKTRFAYTLHFIDQACHFPKTNWLYSN